MLEHLIEDNEKLVQKFGAQRINSLNELPDFYTFKNELIYSHRDFDTFYQRLLNKEKSAIVSGFNASGTIHLGHKIIFDTNLFFQKQYGLPVFIPISDDESYISKKVKTQKEGLENSINLVKELLAYGFDPKKTYFIIDQIYTNIYNLAFKLSKKVTFSEIKAAYGYENNDNPGLIFYPCVQSAHILLPQEEFNIKNTLVVIGPDEDAHIRICRDLAKKFNYEKPSVIHSNFLPGIDSKKMSKSRNNAIFLKDTPQMIRKKVNNAFSGGGRNLEEHKKNGGNPDIDISCIYLSKLFYNKEESTELFLKYRSGELMSGEVKKILYEKITSLTEDFQAKNNRIKKEDIEKVLLKNKTINYLQN